MTYKITLQAIIITGILVTGIGLPLDAFADTVTPKKQIQLGIEKNKVFCKADLFKIIKKSDGTPKCVEPETAKKLIKTGWAQTIDTKKIDQFIQTLKSRHVMGTITIQEVLKQPVTPKIVTSTPATDHYNVVFEVCSDDSAIKLPEVLLSSDSETKYIKLVENIPANTCQTNTGKVKATNQDTIKVQLVNKGEITKKITELENKVKELNDQISAEKSQLSTKLEQAQDPNEFKPDEKRIPKISDLRNQLNAAKEELNRHLFAYNVLPTHKSTDVKTLTSFAGTPLQGIVVNKLSATPQIQQEGGFDVVFEICAGSQMVRIPSVMVSSDKETKTIRMADKIVANTCQVSGTKIMASHADLIQVTSGESSNKSVTASNLENKIVELTKELQTQKQALKDLTHLAPRPSDFNQQLEEVSNKIIELRAEITLTKVKLYNFLKQIYE